MEADMAGLRGRRRKEAMGRLVFSAVFIALLFAGMVVLRGEIAPRSPSGAPAAVARAQSASAPLANTTPVLPVTQYVSGRASVRAAADLDSAWVTTLEAGSSVRVTAREGTWAQLADQQ